MKSKEQYVFDYYSINPSARFSKAYEISNEVHRWHIRKDGTKYIVHPLEGVYVAQIVGINDEDDHIVIILHDTIEESRDQGGKIITREDIEKEFGTEIADDVFALTKERGLDVRGSVNYFREIGKKPRRVFVKIDDRYINIRRGMFGIFSDEKTGEYAYETRYGILPLSEIIITLAKSEHDFPGKEEYVKYAKPLRILRGAIKGILRGADYSMHLYQEVRKSKKLIEKIKALENELQTYKDKLE